MTGGGVASGVAPEPGQTSHATWEKSLSSDHGSHPAARAGGRRPRYGRTSTSIWPPRSATWRPSGSRGSSPRCTGCRRCRTQDRSPWHPRSPNGERRSSGCRWTGPGRGQATGGRARVAALAVECGRGPSFVLAAGRLAFCGGFDLTDPDALVEAATAAGLDAEPVLRAAGDRGRDELLLGAGRRCAGHDVPAVRVGTRLFAGEGALDAAALAAASGSVDVGPGRGAGPRAGRARAEPPRGRPPATQEPPVATVLYQSAARIAGGLRPRRVGSGPVRPSL